MRELPEDLLPSDGGASQMNQSTELSFMEAKRESLKHFEKAYLQSILNHCAGNVSRAAETADVDRKTFYRLLRKHHLEPAAYRV
jgi:transcriptional regulator of acetoin/glycerol metabolism